MITMEYINPTVLLTATFLTLGRTAQPEEFSDISKNGKDKKKRKKEMS